MERAASCPLPNDGQLTIAFRARGAIRFASLVVLCAALIGSACAVLAGDDAPLHMPRVVEPGVVQPGIVDPRAIQDPRCPLPERGPVPPSKDVPGSGPNAFPTTRPTAGPILGTTPQATAASRAKLEKYIDKFIDAESTLDLIVGQTRVMYLKATPSRILIADENTAAYNLASPKELFLQGQKVGTTTLNFWFSTDPKDPNSKDPAKLEVLSYLLRVLPDPEERLRRERALKLLAEQINLLFCNSTIDIYLVGDKIVVTGRSHDIEEATQILRLIRSSTAGGDAARIPVEPARETPAKTSTPSEGPPSPALDVFNTAGGPNVINLLQVTGEQQVKLHVILAEVNRAAARSIGLNFSITNNNGITVFRNNTGNLFGTGNNANAGGGINFAGAAANLLAILDGGQIPLAIDALRTVNYARTRNETVLTTLNGVTANFQAGGSFPVPVVTGNTANGLLGTSFVPFGDQLAFTPFVTDKDRIRLTINANVSDRDLSTGTSIAGSAVSGLTTRNFNTTVELRDGETLAVAGLIQSNIGGDSNTVPFIGDLPFVGPLTGLKRVQAGEQELVILIRPELVHPSPPGANFTLPGADLFEPNDIEFYLIGRIESHHELDYRSSIRDDLSRMRQYYQNDLGRIQQYNQLEQKYLSGPVGFSEAP